jgi:hypothetical protein
LKRLEKSRLNGSYTRFPLSCDLGGQRSAQFREFFSEGLVDRVAERCGNLIQGRNPAFGVEVVLENLPYMRQLADRFCSPLNPPVTAPRAAVIYDDLAY